MNQYNRITSDWFAESFGISVHWTSRSQPLSGPAMNFQDAVDNFDILRFVGQLKELGAKHLIFTTTHAEHYIACPHPIVDQILPGRTCRRDLLGELANSLFRENIRLIFYYNHSCNGEDDLAWKKSVGYLGAPLDIFASRVLDIIAFLAKRYGKLISGWWFDSCYSLDPSAPKNSVTTEMDGWLFPWEGLTAAAKSGNQESIVAYNSGINETYHYTEHQDYYAGETVSLDFLPKDQNFAGLQTHQWTCIDNQEWVHDKADTHFVKLLYQNDELAEFTRRIINVGGAVTYNIEIDQLGVMNPKSLEQLSEVFGACQRK